MSALFAIILTVLAIFLILLVLVQRGRGGGLAGALGGVGGSSAFGAKAGDVFTRITMVTASIWIAVCVMAVYWANNRSDVLGVEAEPRSRVSSEFTAAPTDSQTDATTGPEIRPPMTTEGAESGATQSSGDASPADSPAADSPANDQ